MIQQHSSSSQIGATTSPQNIKQQDVQQAFEQDDIDSQFQEHFDAQSRQLSKIVNSVQQNYQAAAMQRKEKELESVLIDDTQVSKPFYTTVALTPPPMNPTKVQQLSPLVSSNPLISHTSSSFTNIQNSQQTPTMLKSVSGFNSGLNTIEEDTFPATNQPRQAGDQDNLPEQTSNIQEKYAGEQYQKKMRSEQLPASSSQQLPTVFGMGQRSGSMQIKPNSSILPQISNSGGMKKKSKNSSQATLVLAPLASTSEAKSNKKKRNQTSSNTLRSPFNIPRQIKEMNTPVLKQKHGGPYGFPPSKFDKSSHIEQSKSFSAHHHSQQAFKKRKTSVGKKKPQNKNNSRKIEFQYYPVKEKKFKNGCYYNGQWKGKKMHGRGVLIFPNETRYAGQFKEGCAEGYGEKYWPDGRSYKGYWKQNKMHGKGELMALTMDLYIGGFKNGFPHGNGIRRWPNGDIYQGQYKIGYQDGVGTFISIQQGWKYMGDWVLGMMQGRAVCQWSDGTIYQGGWAGCLKEGDGILTYSDGTIVEGQFKADLPNGIGRKIFPDSSYYNGSLVNGMFHGYGNFRWNDGSQFEGSWNNNQIKGKGTWKFANGVVIQGNFEKQSVNGQALKKIPDPQKGEFVFRGMMKKGRYDGLGEFRWPDGRHYIGNFKNQRMHGKGKLVFTDHFNGKAVYKGEFIDNQFDGKGKLQFSSGDTYDGLFRAGAFHGYGVYSYMGGKIVYEGQFIKNVSHGKGKLSTPQVQFEGYFNGGLLQKKGKAFYKNGDQYLGTFKKSQMHGYGCYRYADGVKIIGVYQDGQIKNGKKVYPDGRIYIGQLLQQTQNGKGIMLSKYGEKSGGLWQKGKIIEQITDMGTFNIDYDKINEDVSFSSSKFIADDTRDQNINDKSTQYKYNDSIKKIEEALASQSEREDQN